eukprot:EG_transcript_37762
MGLIHVVLHCIALHCIALHCIALHCIALHCIALHCIALHCIACCCDALRCVVLMMPFRPAGVHSVPAAHGRKWELFGAVPWLPHRTLPTGGVWPWRAEASSPSTGTTPQTSRPSFTHWWCSSATEAPPPPPDHRPLPPSEDLRRTIRRPSHRTTWDAE